MQSRNSSRGIAELAAVVLYTGHLAYTYPDGTAVLPHDSLWTPPGTASSPAGPGGVGPGQFPGRTGLST